MLKRLLPLFFLLSFFLLSNGKVFAIEQGDLGAYPTNYDPNNPKTKSWFIYELKPGEIKNDSISVVNNSTKTLTVKIYAVDATTTNDGAFALLNENQKQHEVGTWVTLSKNLITVPPLDRVNVPFTIHIPDNTTVGDHPGGIIVQEVTKPSTASQGMGVNIVSRVGTRIYETVPGAQVINMDLRDLQYKIVDNHLVFTFVMENLGNIILTPVGTLDIKDHSGNVLDTIPLGTLGSVFPGKPTTITATSHIPAPLFGQYTATVTINYSPTKAIQKSLTFFIYVKDWRLAAGAAGVIVVLLILLLVLFRKIFHHTHTVKEIRKRRYEFWEEEKEKPRDAFEEALEEHAEPKHKKTKHVSTKILQSRPAQAEIPEEYVDQLFIAHHMKLLVILVCFTILIFSTLFALLLQQFVLSRAETKTQQSGIQPAAAPSTGVSQYAPTAVPTPTNIPVAKSDIKVVVLNGSGKAGAARTVANTLTQDGFTVIKTDNAPQDATLTTIEYPQGKADGADQLAKEIQSTYPDVKEESTDATVFTITLSE